MQPILQRIDEIGILATAESVAPRDATAVGNALVSGDIPAVLLSYRDNAEELIRAFTSSVPDLVIGVEDVRSSEQAGRAIDAGAQYIITATFDPAVVDFCLDSDIAVFPRVSSLSEAEVAVRAGVEAVCLAVRPDDMLPELKNFTACPRLRFIVTEGFDPQHARDYRSIEKICAVRDDRIVPKNLTLPDGADEITRRAKEAVWALHDFTLLHLGVNCSNENQSLDSARKMETLFGFPVRERPNSVFAGLGFEFMKKPDLGEKGHIAIATPNVRRAAAYLAKKGIQSISGTERYDDDGSMRRLYIDLDLLGFAVHLRKYPN